MEKRRTGDLKLIQELNRSIILDVIRKKGPISRSEIAKTVGISPTTATSAVNDLIKDKLVYENGVGNSSGGRKPVMLCFNPNVYSIIGVALSNSIIKIAEINLEGKVIRKQIYSNRQLFGEEMVRYFLEAIGQFINEQLSVVKCQGISIITPGIVDTDNGIITYNSKLRLFNVPLKKLVEEKTGLPTLIENDANSYVIAENYFGLFSKYKDMLYITLGDGVGSGIMVDGSIYRGHMGSSGEIGHTTVVLDGVRCECGNKGCLENYVNWPTIYSKIVSALVTKGRDTVFKEIVMNDWSKLNPEVFVQAVNQGDELATEIQEEIVEYLSIALLNVIHMFNPEVIILNGRIVQNNPLFVEMINQRISKKLIPVLRNKVNVQGTSLGADFDLKAPAAVLIQKKFKFKFL